uniref:Protein kinase domain-containing protein n=1 Tax=Oryza punctata TaxID=4537 RepID=A0A0E0JKA0_ORYPU
MYTGGLSKLDIALITISGIVIPVLLLILSGFIIQRIRDYTQTREIGDWYDEIVRQQIGMGFLLYPFSIIRESTGNFSIENRLGRGSFGQVYRSISPSKFTMAYFVFKQDFKLFTRVYSSKLDQDAWQGLSEFLNEIRLILRLRHANLVSLLGCCVYRRERILVYEYMRNKSLDYVLSYREGAESLSWLMRLRIIDGIAQGLVYLRNYMEQQIYIIQRHEAKQYSFGQPKQSQNF